MSNSKAEQRELAQRIKQEMAKASYWGRSGKDERAEHHINNALEALERLDTIVNGNARRKRSGKAPAKSGNRYQALIKGMAGFLGVTAADILQHVTTETEIKIKIQQYRDLYTKGGKLDTAAYCKALNSWRDNLLFTISELEKAIEDARREGNNAVIPGYETAIEQYKKNAEIIAGEIRQNGGKVN